MPVTLILQEFNINQVVIWSDSEAALQWVRNNGSKIVYVRNRVANILEIGAEFQFLHVASRDNPADLVTRGISLKQFFKESQCWMHGPPWLPHPQEWPVQKASVAVGMYEITAEVVAEPPKVVPIFGYTKYSSLRPLLPSDSICA